MLRLIPFFLMASLAGQSSPCGFSSSASPTNNGSGEPQAPSPPMQPPTDHSQVPAEVQDSTNQHTQANPMPPSKSSNSAPSRHEIAAGNAINSFGFEYFAQLRRGSSASQTNNLIFSPLSIMFALGMTQSGADGQTAEEMAKTLHLDALGDASETALGHLRRQLTQPSEGVDLAIANRLFGAKSLNIESAFLSAQDQNFGAALEQLDFQSNPEGSRTHINQWVEKQTKTRIRNLLLPGTVNPSTSLVLVNAVWFKGQWQYAFDPKATKPGDFHLSSGKKVSVPMMSQSKNLPAFADEKHGIRLVDLAYVGENISMTILLPKDHTSLSTLESSLTAQSLDQWLSQATSQSVQLTLPRFKLAPSKPISLNKDLQALGMKQAFDSSLANFSKIVKPPTKIAVGDVIHKAMIEVNEEGTEAAASTAVTTYRTSAQIPFEFKADRPFLCLIRDRKSKAILFIARVVDPSAAA